MEFSNEAKKQRKYFVEFLDGLITWQTFLDKKDDPDPTKKFKLARIEHGPLVRNERPMEYYNTQGAGVYIAINETDGKGRKAENVIHVRCLFADLDGAPLAPVMEDMPDLVVESSPGKYHAYWRIADCPLNGFRQLQQSIAQRYNSDTTMCDLPRILRCPGFFHLKGDPFMVRIIYKPKPSMLTFAEACEKWPPPPRKQFSAARYQKSEDGEFKGQYGTGEGQRNVHVMKRLCGAIKRGVRGDSLVQEAMLEGLACSPPLSEQEILSIVNSVSRYA